jgi:medium-chain acyl-CoA ligase, mitochondrial
VNEVEQILNVKHFRSIYGLTETTVAAFQSLPTDGNESIQEFVGCLLDHTEAKIVDESGNVVPFGQPGELCLKGYNIMMGYCGDEKKTKESFDEGKW